MGVWYDCRHELYSARHTDNELAQVSAQEQRILLTRDRGLLKRGQVEHGYWVRATEPRRQFVEVLRRLDLFGQADPCGTACAATNR